MTNHTHGGTDAPECTTCENNDDKVYFQEPDRAIEVSVGDLIVIDNYIFRCTSLMINHDEPPTVLFDSIVHEMKKPVSDTVKEEFEKGLFPRNEIVSSIFKEVFSNFDEVFGKKE